MWVSFFFSLAFAVSPAQIGETLDTEIPNEELKVSSFGPEDERVLTKEGFEKMLSDIACENYEMHTEIVGENVKKSEVVQEVFFLLQEHGASFPPKSFIIRFNDLSDDMRYYSSAQALVALGILELKENGLFGIIGNADPFVSYIETKNILEKAFLTNQCGFVINSDRDHDGIENNQDVCPLIPGDENGCPQFPVRSYVPADTSFVLVKEAVGAEETGITFQEKTDIRLGDFFRAVVKGKWGENISESREKEVEN